MSHHKGSDSSSFAGLTPNSSTASSPDRELEKNLKGPDPEELNHRHEEHGKQQQQKKSAEQQPQKGQQDSSPSLLNKNQRRWIKKPGQKLKGIPIIGKCIEGFSYVTNECLRASEYVLHCRCFRHAGGWAPDTRTGYAPSTLGNTQAYRPYDPNKPHDPRTDAEKERDAKHEKSQKELQEKTNKSAADGMSFG